MFLFIAMLIIYNIVLWFYFYYSLVKDTKYICLWGYNDYKGHRNKTHLFIHLDIEIMTYFENI